jgi:cysteinyl-tRNA synthetase
MPLRVYNSLTRRKEPFIPTEGKTIKMFVCGPTVYDCLHLGHARTYIAFDIIARYLQFLGYNLHYIMNVTDVAERVFDKAGNLKRDPMALAREYEASFLEDMKSLEITNVERYIRASDYIPQMLAQVRSLVERRMAYETETGVYFEVRNFPKFGQLSGLTKEQLSLKRFELCSSKKNSEDFSLWRKYEKGLFGWDSPWGHGRPGWHIEDTAISMATFGDTYDVHGGGSELIFPHHEAEIAQAEALSGKSPFVKLWLHTGLLSVGGKKMSKSLGNLIRIRDALKQYTAHELRYYFASFHYRQPVVISDAGLKQAKRSVKALEENVKRFSSHHVENNISRAISSKLSGMVLKGERTFRNHMDNDFDTPRALAVLMSLSDHLAEFANRGLAADDRSKQKAKQVIRDMANVFGILPQSTGN